ncbi:MAG: hypothetical protein R3C19_25915 [Planctomycetaceae bacterium]
MRTVTGAILLLVAEQCYAHSCMIAFPNQEAAVQVLIPGSIVALFLGTGFLIWGILTERRCGVPGHRSSDERAIESRQT